MAPKTAEKEATDAATEEKPKKGKKKLLIIAVAAIVVLGAGWFFFLKPSGAPKEPPPPEPGVVAALEPIHINLAGGHYLKLGLALQATADAHEEPDGSHALDIAIKLFSNREMAELRNPKEREHLQDELTEEVKHAYHEHVMDVYFTEFVMQ